jgi:hypothetical protein
MIIRPCRYCLPILVLGFATASAEPARAQEPIPNYQQVISANPFGLLLEFFNAEYERALGESSTGGFGGSTFSSSGEHYVNADVFYRYYPGEGAFRGWAFGGKAGITHVSDSGTYFGFGFDVNHSWLMGRKENFYVGVGFGLKRLFGLDDNALDEDGDELLDFIPTIRIVNVGFAF